MPVNDNDELISTVSASVESSSSTVSVDSNRTVRTRVKLDEIINNQLNAPRPLQDGNTTGESESVHPELHDANQSLEPTTSPLFVVTSPVDESVIGVKSDEPKSPLRGEEPRASTKTQHAVNGRDEAVFYDDVFETIQPLDAQLVSLKSEQASHSLSHPVITTRLESIETITCSQRDNVISHQLSAESSSNSNNSPVTDNASTNLFLPMSTNGLLHSNEV